jgi:glycogen debranching enzyme
VVHRLQIRARGNQHYVYSGQALLVTNLDGWVSGAGTEGFYFKNTRFLSRDEVVIDGNSLRPAAVSPAGAEAFLGYYEAPANSRIPERTLYLEVGRHVGEGLRTELKLTNYSRDTPLAFELGILLDADFAYSDEAESGQRQQVAPVNMSWDPGCRRVVFRYCHERLDLSSAIRIQREAGDIAFEEKRLVVPVELAPRASATLQILTEPILQGATACAPATVFGGKPVGTAAVVARLQSRLPVLSSSNHTVVRAWETATADLASLPLGFPEGPAVPVAGLPLYQQFFGRDSLTISWQALMATSELMHDSLVANAAWQGTRIDDWLDEEPGKMIHQARWGPLSALGTNAFSRYYGDWATPVDFLIMLGQYLLWTGDRTTVKSLLPAARRALEWAETYGDLDRDGFLEYQTHSLRGVKHQGWKDSDDAIVDAQGRMIEPPLACCEIQAYWYAGLQQAAVGFLCCGDAVFALELLRRAAALRKRFNNAFWMEEKAFYAMAIGPDGRLVDSISSNPGHLLAAGIVPPERARRVAARLMAHDMFSGWGIRTLSSDNPFYNPFSYHRGSVWPVEQGTIAFGFARYGLWEELHRLAEGVFDLSELFVANRLPEVVGGIPRDDSHPHPGIYPYSCEPQGWSASMVVMLIQSLLGLRPIAPLRLLVIDPHLPGWLPELTLTGLKVGDARLNLSFWRTKSGETDYRVEREDGSVRVIRQAVPDSGAPLSRRLLDLMASATKG